MNIRDVRTGTIVNTIGIVVCLIGGSLLFAYTLEVSRTNSHFICGFGRAIAAQPLSQREAETDQEFRQRVATTRQFVTTISEELEDCEGNPRLTIHEDSKDVLGGVDVGGGNNNPSGRPSPPPGGREVKPERPPAVPETPIPSPPGQPPAVPETPTPSPPERPCNVNVLGICVQLPLP